MAKHLLLLRKRMDIAQMKKKKKKKGTHPADELRIYVPSTHTHTEKDVERPTLDRSTKERAAYVCSSSIQTFAISHFNIN